MKMELPQALIEDLEAAAVARKQTVEQLVHAMLLNERPSLRGLALPDPPPNRVRIEPAAGREETEKRALWMRLAERTGAKVEGTDAKELHRAAAIPPSSFLLETHQETARLIDDQSARVLDPSFECPTVPVGRVLDAIRIDRRSVLIEFQVHARVPLASTLECTPFGGASAIRLLAKESPVFDPHSLELVAVEIEIPIREMAGRIPDHLDAVVKETDRGFAILQPEFEEASVVLEHILKVLNLKGIVTHYEPVRGDLGPPYSVFQKDVFRDGSIRTSSGLTSFPYRWSSNEISRYAVAAPLKIREDLFSDTWERGASELALASKSRSLALAEHFRRMMLIVESGFSRRPSRADNGLSEGLKTKEALELIAASRLASPRTFAEFATDASVASELVEVRDLVSHLQRHTLFDGLLEEKGRPYGLILPDRELRRRLPVAIALAEGIVDAVLRFKLPPDTFTNFMERDVSVDELLDLHNSSSYLLSEAARKAVEIRLIVKLRDSSITPARERFVTQLILQRSSVDGLIELARGYSEATKHAVRVAPDGTDDFGLALRASRLSG